MFCSSVCVSVLEEFQFENLGVWQVPRLPKCPFPLYAKGSTFHVFMLIYDLERLVRPILGLSKASFPVHDLLNLSIFVLMCINS